MFACIAHVPPPADAGTVSPGTVSPGIASTVPPAITTALTELASDFSPRFEVVREDFVVVDVSGLERLLGPPQDIGDACARLARERGLSVGIAIAATQTTAMVLALAQAGAGGVGGGVGGENGEDGPIIVPLGQEAAALAPLSLDWLAVLPVAGSAADAAYLRRASPPTSGGKKRASVPTTGKAVGKTAAKSTAQPSKSAAAPKRTKRSSKHSRLAGWNYRLAPPPLAAETPSIVSRTVASTADAVRAAEQTRPAELAVPGAMTDIGPRAMTGPMTGPMMTGPMMTSTVPGAAMAGAAPGGVAGTGAGAVAGVLSMLSAREREAIAARATLLDILDRWGLRTFGDFARLPVVDIFERLGDAGVRLQQIARGQDARPLVHTPAEEPFEATFTLDWPLETLEPLSFVVTRLLEPLCARLERADRAAAVLDTALRLVNRTHYTRRLELPAAMRDPKVLRTLVLLDLESHPPTAGIDGVTITIHPTPGRIVQHSLLTRALPPPEQLSTLIARLTAVMGEGRVGAPALVDTHRPEAFDMHRFAPPEQAPVEPLPPERTLLDRMLPEPPSGERRDRQRDRERARETPTAVARLTLRRFRQPVLAQVTVEDGRPVHVMPQGLPGGRVTQAAGPWRISGNWWSASWDRDEWDVSLQNGHVYHLHHERAQSHWFVAGCYD
jgi:protein ImuB